MVITLRRTVNVVSALAAVGLIAFISSSLTDRLKEKRAVEAVATDVSRFRQVLAYRAAANQTEVNTRGWPVTIDPAWFGSDPPRNTLVTPERPWVEVATPGEASLQDPVVRMTLTPTTAAFWYNPYQGVVRARVPVSLSDRKSLELYNTINGTRLTEIYGVPPEPVAAGATGTTGASGQTGATGEDAATRAARTALAGEENAPAAPGSAPHK
jgi:hypothetical protein